MCDRIFGMLACCRCPRLCMGRKSSRIKPRVKFNTTMKAPKLKVKERRKTVTGATILASMNNMNRRGPIRAMNSDGDPVQIQLQRDLLEPGWLTFVESIFKGVFHPRLMAWIIFIGAYFFVFAPAIDKYTESCTLSKKYVLNDGVIEAWYYKEINATTHIFTDGKEGKGYDRDCAKETNSIFEVISGLMIFMLTLALSDGLEKYREILRMYDEITGDIKALAMMMVHITYDKQKYEKERKEDGSFKILFKDEDKFNRKGEHLTPVERQYLKVKYLLASLPKVVVDTINDDGGNRGIRIDAPGSTCSSQFFKSINKCCKASFLSWYYDPFTPFCGLSERALVQLTPDTTCYRCCFGNKMKYPNYWKDYKDNEKRNEFGKEQLQHSLYVKVKNIHKITDLDAFECVMTCLLDELQRLNENGLGFGEDEGSAVVSAIFERWGLIYGTWGSLSSLKFYEEPWGVNFLRAGLLLSYALLIPNRYVGYAEVDNVYFNTVVLLCMLELGIFTLMWYLAYVIRNPFRPTLCIRGLQRTSLVTQNQVVSFMDTEQIKRWDNLDYINGSYYGWTEDGQKVNPIGIGKIPFTEAEKRRNIRKGKPAPNVRVNAKKENEEEKNFVRFKNVNF